MQAIAPDRVARVFGRATGTFLTLLLCVAGGCATYSSAPQTTSAAESPAASPRQHAMLENIPLPVGFRMVYERSVAKDFGRYRMAKCEFQGSSPPDTVARFYQSYMPSAQFVLRTRSLEAGTYDLRFESATEECNIRVSPSREGTVLVVDLGPLPQGTPERDAAPPVPRR